MENLDETLSQLISKLSDKQKANIIKYLEFQLVPDVYSDVETEEARNEIYRTYSTVIADLIAKVEVYSHTLPYNVVDLIDLMWQLMSGATVANNELAKRRLYYFLEKLCEHTINELRFILIQSYEQTLKGYGKTLKCFNHNLVCNDEGMPILTVIDCSLKEIRRYVKSGCRFRRTHTRQALNLLRSLSNDEAASVQLKRRQGMVAKIFGRWLNKSLLVDKVSNICEFEKAQAIAEKAIKDCEKGYPKIIGNGYAATVYEKVGICIINLISLFLIVYGVLKLFVL